MIERDVRIIGDVRMGPNVDIAGPTEIMAKDSLIKIGRGCDIAAFVTITTADSHMKTIGKSQAIARKPILIDDHVFIGTGAVILGGTKIGHHAVIGAGVVLSGQDIPPWSRVRVQAPIVEDGFYALSDTERRRQRTR